MKLPEKILVLGREIAVIEQKNLLFKGDPCGGVYDHEKRTIFIDPEEPEQEIFTAFCHEVAHVYLHFLGWDQKLNEREAESFCQVSAMYVEDIIKSLHPVVEKSKRKIVKK